VPNVFIGHVSGDILPAADWNSNYNLLETSLLDIGNFVISGLVPSAGAGLSVSVTAGHAFIGADINFAASFNITALTDNTTNHLYVLQNGTGTSNTTGTAPAMSAKLGTCVTAGGVVTSVATGRNSGRQQFQQPQALIPGGPAAGITSAGHLASINLNNWAAAAAEGIAVFGVLPAGALPAETDTFAGLTDVVLTAPAQGDVYYRNAAGQVVNLAPGTSGQFLKTQGAAANPVWATATDTDTFAALTDVVLTAPAQGDVYYRNAAGNVVNLGPGTSGQFLQTQGAAANPLWATVPADTDSYATLTDVTLTALAQGAVPYYNGTKWVNLNPGTAGQVLTTQGAAANPTWSNAPSPAPDLILSRAGAATPADPKYLTITPGADTALTASTEANDVLWSLNRTQQFATGALTTQRAVWVRQPTYGFVGASTITLAATVAIEGAPLAGANATLTTSAALAVFTGSNSGRGIIARTNSASQTGALWESQDSTGQGWTQLDAGSASYKPGLTIWLTTDQTTNYSRTRINTDAAGNFYIQGDKGGGGTAPYMNWLSGGGGVVLFPGGGTWQYSVSGTNINFNFPTDKAVVYNLDPRALDTSTMPGFYYFNTFSSWTVSNNNTQTLCAYAGTWAPSSSAGKFIQVSYAPLINQTGSASGDYTVLQILPTETSATGTNKRLIEAGTAAQGVTWDLTSTGVVEMRGLDSTTKGTLVGTVVPGFNSNTHASYTGRIIHNAVDASGTRECLRLEGDGSAARLGFLGAAAVVRQTGASAAGIAAITDANAKAAVNALQVALAALGLITSPA
jgi:hypothetical protein